MLQYLAPPGGEGSSALSRQDAKCCFEKRCRGCDPNRGGGPLEVEVGRQRMCCGSKVELRHGEHASPSVAGAGEVVQRGVGRHDF